MYNDLDDTPSYFRQQNYHSLYVAPCKIDFDEMDRYLLRNNTLSNTHVPDFVKSFPRQYDQVINYYPTEE